jgi:tRNA threonylcarbamoyladenosine biosynthesis protein TsaB
LFFANSGRHATVLLALDTSTLTLSVALLDGARLVEHVIKGPPLKQSELLPGELADLLARHGVALATLEGIAVGRGPGSFTGLRIGISAVKALAYAQQLKVAAVSSLAAVAHQVLFGSGTAPAEGREIWACAVARINELYLGPYRCAHGRLQPVAPEDALTPEELAQRLIARPEVALAGPGLVDYGARLRELGVAPSQLQAGAEFPSAVSVAALAVLPATFELDALFSLEPHYVRPSEAERNPKFPPLPGPPPTARLKED